MRKATFKEDPDDGWSQRQLSKVNSGAAATASTVTLAFLRGLVTFMVVERNEETR